MKRALVGASFVVMILGCDTDTSSHVFVAYRYEVARECLNPSTSLDVVPSDQAALACAPACLVRPSPPAAAFEVYVSTMCGPYPADLDTSGTNPACPGALAAFARGPDVCNSDGTSSSPPETDDAGQSDDAGEGDDDASSEDGAIDASPDDAAADAGGNR